MNTAVVAEMLEKRADLEETIRLMRSEGLYSIPTPFGPVKISEVLADAQFIDMMLMEELEDLPIAGVLINLYK